MRILSANLWCFNPWQQQSIEDLCQLQSDILVFQEIKPQLTNFVRQYAAENSMTMIETETNKKMTLGILSCLPVSHSEIIDGGDFAQRPQLKIQLSSGITIFGIHLMAPITPQKYQQRNRQLEQLADLINQESNPAIAIGDFNTDISESAFRQFIEQTKDCSHGRKTLSGQKTWLSILPLFAIDHLIYTNHFQQQSFTVETFNCSDHLPISAEVNLNGQD